MKIWFFDMKYESSTAATLSFSCALVRWSLWSYDRRSSAMIGQNGWRQKLWIWWLDEMEGEGGGIQFEKSLLVAHIFWAASWDKHDSFFLQTAWTKKISCRFVSFRFVFQFYFFSSSKESALTNQMKRSREKLMLKKGAYFWIRKMHFNRYYQYAISTKWNVFVINLVPWIY